MTNVSRLLNALSSGEQLAADELFPLVYNELRTLAAQKMSRENPGQTLQPTALVHEAYMRLVDAEAAKKWENRNHFFAAAAEAMRRILVENARRKKRVKHGGEVERVALQNDALPERMSVEDILAINDALDEFAKIQPACAELVKLRYFAGLTLDECAAALNIPVRTAYRDWAFARSWLFRYLGGDKGL